MGIEIHTLLNLRSDATSNEIKVKYYKLIFQLHPSTKKTGNESEYIELQEAYRRYVAGDSFSNCFLVCENTRGTLSCRCGGVYQIEKSAVGKIECEFCSCHIIVENPVLALA